MDNQTEKTGTINILSKEDFYNAHSKNEFLEKLEEKDIDVSKVLRTIDYEEELIKLQIELVKFQQWLYKKKSE